MEESLCSPPPWWGRVSLPAGRQGWGVDWDGRNSPFEKGGYRGIFKRLRRRHPQRDHGELGKNPCKKMLDCLSLLFFKISHKRNDWRLGDIFGYLFRFEICPTEVNFFSEDHRKKEVEKWVADYTYKCFKKPVLKINNYCLKYARQRQGHLTLPSYNCFKWQLRPFAGKWICLGCLLSGLSLW